MTNFGFHSVEEKIAQVVALAVRKMAMDESWVAPSVAPHVGKTISVSLPILGHVLNLRWLVDATAILVANTAVQEPASVQLSVESAVYSSLVQQPFDMQRVMRHVQISGDAQLAEWVNRLVQQLRPNVWEDLSKIIGDVPSFYAQQGAQKLFSHFKQTVSILTGYGQHYLLDSEPVLVRHAKLEVFADDVRQLRYATERLTQRIEQLKSGMK